MSNYKIAEEVIRKEFEKYGVLNDVDAAAGDTLSKMIKVQAAAITGSPDAESLPGGAKNPANDADRFDAAIKIEDLRELNEAQVRKIAFKVLQDMFTKVPMPGGGTLADVYDFSDTPAEGSQKPRPIVTVNTSVNGRLAPVDILNILVALPKDITHSQVVASIAGKTLVQAPAPVVNVAADIVAPAVTANATIVNAPVCPAPVVNIANNIANNNTPITATVADANPQSVTATVTEQTAPGFAAQNPPKAPLLATPPAGSAVDRVTAQAETGAVAAR